MYSSFNARAVGLNLPASETIDLTAHAGFGGVDLLVRDLDLDQAGNQPANLRRRMNDLGLRGGAFPLPVDWRGDHACFRRDHAALPRLADLAASLGLFRTGTWVMPEQVDTSATTLQLHVDRLGAIADVLVSRGIRIGLEVIGPATSRTGRTPRFITRLSDLGPILGPLSERLNVGILVDAFHLYAAGESLDEAIVWGIESVAWVHVADLPAGAPPDRDQIRDAERGLPGENGAVDVASVLSTLKRRGYDGPVTVEPMGHCPSLLNLTPIEVATRVAWSLKSVWPA